jgi:hypothetical protein
MVKIIYSKLILQGGLVVLYTLLPIAQYQVLTLLSEGMQQRIQAVLLMWLSSQRH